MISTNLFCYTTTFFIILIFFLSKCFSFIFKTGTLIRPVFNKYDAAPRNNRLDKAEFRALMRDLNEDVVNYLEDGVTSMSTGEAVDELFNRWDTSRDNEIDFNEFCEKFYERTKGKYSKANAVPQNVAGNYR